VAAPQGGFGNAYPPPPDVYGAQPPAGAPAPPQTGSSAPPTGRIAGSASVSGAGGASAAGPGPTSPFAPPETSVRIPSTPGVYGSQGQPAGPDQYGSTQPFDAGATQYGADPTRVGSPYQPGPVYQPGYDESAPRFDEQQPGGGQPYGAATQTYGSPAQPPGSDQPYGGSGGPTYGAPPAEKSRRGLVIGIVVAAVVVVILGAVGAYLAFSGGGGGSSNYSVGSCVKHSGDQATSVDCSASDAYKITSTVDSPTKCPDQSQPYVILQRSGAADQVLCLKPAH
jgi:hypothetical protein